MPYALILDVLVAVLLVVTIIYAVMLNRRLARLRNDKDELQALARTFGESTQRADESISRLRQTADALDQRIEKAQALRDDLVFLMDRGGSVADRLEGSVRQARDDLGVGPAKGATPSQPVRTVEAAAEAAEAAERAAVRTAREAPEVARDSDDEPRSAAERELLRALRTAG